MNTTAARHKQAQISHWSWDDVKRRVPGLEDVDRLQGPFASWWDGGETHFSVSRAGQFVVHDRPELCGGIYELGKVAGFNDEELCRAKYGDWCVSWGVTPSRLLRMLDDAELIMWEGFSCLAHRVGGRRRIYVMEADMHVWADPSGVEAQWYGARWAGRAKGPVYYVQHESSVWLLAMAGVAAVCALSAPDGRTPDAHLGHLSSREWRIVMQSGDEGAKLGLRNFSAIARKAGGSGGGIQLVRIPNDETTSYAECVYIQDSLRRSVPLSRAMELLEIVSTDEWSRLNSIYGVGKEQGSHVVYAHRLKHAMGSDAHLVYDRSAFWQYDELTGTWARLPHSALCLWLMAQERDEEAPRMTAGAQESIIRNLIPMVERDGFFDNAPIGVVDDEGFWTYDPHSAAIVRLEHHPMHRQLHRVHGTLDGAEEPTVWMDCLRYWMEPLEDAEGMIQVLREFVGVALLERSVQFQQALMLTGTGSNGKSVFLGVVESLFPEGSVAHVSPQSLGHEYYAAELAGKRLNVCGDIDAKEIVRSAALKKVVAGDSMIARSVRQQPFSFRPRAGHLFSANELPPTTDYSHGFWRRFIVVPFNRVIADEEKDSELLAKLQQERLGIVRWALEGAATALRRGRFEQTVDSRAELQRWQVESDSVLTWINEACVETKTDELMTKASVLYQAYSEFAKTRNMKPVSMNKWGRRLGGQVSKSCRRDGNYYGLVLRSFREEPADYEPDSPL